MGIRLVLAVVMTSGLALAAGCSGNSKKGGGVEGMGDSNQDLMPKVDPELCDTSGKQVQTFDLNQDNQPDVWKLYAQMEEDGAKLDVLTCKQVDYDHDGKKDYVAIYNKQGELVAEEFDFTFDGKFDSREHYDKKSGQIYMVERDLDHNKNPDTWEKYDTSGSLESIERDRNGDGKPDLWEQYQKGVLLAILYDDDFDRKVDRKESARPLPAPSSSTPTPPAPGSAPAPGEQVDTVEGDVKKAPGDGPKDETPTAPGKEAPKAKTPAKAPSK
jgi:hypothetical protein